MTWSSVLLALFVAHVVGDILFQTDWEAVNKLGGLRARTSARALLTHVTTYTIAFVPVFVWVANNRGAGRALAVAALVALPHLLIDDGRLVRFWLERVKGAQRPAVGLTIAVDQAFHVVCLLGVALLAAASV
jgi:hypothetical protein